MTAGEWEPIVAADWGDGAEWADGAEGDGFEALSFEDEDAHAHHPSDCQYCPICHLIGAVREAAPEVSEQLGIAVNAMFGAAKAALEAYERHNAAQRDRRTSNIEHIDIE